MEKSKNKNVIVKIIFTIIITTVLMIMAGSNVKAGAAYDFVIGSLDINGGEGITAAPHPYIFGDYWCGWHYKQLTRKLHNAIAVYKNRINNEYYNEEIRYKNVGNPKTEQSIAAARYVYEQGQTPNEKTLTYVTELDITKYANEVAEAHLLEGAEFTLTGISKQVVLNNVDYYEASENGTYYLLLDGTYTETAPTGTKYVEIGVGTKDTTTG